MKSSLRTLLIIIVMGLLLVAGTLTHLLWLRMASTQQIAESLPVPATATAFAPVIEERDPPPKPTNLAQAPIYHTPTPFSGAQPVCGKDPEWLVLMVGVDYRGDGYKYGLADVIRLARVDFIEMTVDMIALPRDLLVEAPPGRFTAPDPYKINQAYLFGTPGMRRFTGEGEGAAALAEVIYYNFGVAPEHFLVINFQAFVNVIDAIGGITVDLPAPVHDGKLGSFPAGEQKLTGARALALSRIRSGIGDNGRIENQTQVMRGFINQLVKPANIMRLPGLIQEFSGAFLTDLSLAQSLRLGTCFLRHFDTENLSTYHPPRELITGGSHFIPTLNNNAFVFYWDEALVKWVHTALLRE